MRELVDMTPQELEETLKFLAEHSNHKGEGNIIAAHKLGNSKIIIRDAYINPENIKHVEATIERLYYPNHKITITKRTKEEMRQIKRK